MKPDQSQIEQIRISFAAMQSREDLLHLLNEAKSMIYGNKAVPFKLKQLTYYSNPKLGGKRYQEFRIKKKKPGEFRIIHAPVSGLKTLQRTLAFILQCVFEPHEAAKGFVRGKSIVDNAKPHVGQHYVYNIDLKDFFPSIDQARVWKCLQLKPFNLNDSSESKQVKVAFEIIPFDEIYKEFNPSHVRFIKSTKGNYLHLIKFVDGKENYITLKLGPTVNLVGITPEEKLKEIISNSCDLVVYHGETNNRPWATLSRKRNHDYRQKSIISSRLSIANIISAICSAEMNVERKSESGVWITEKRYVLPQGAPTSPVLTNIVCQHLDFILAGVAKRFGLRYSRYADDITFSSKHNVYQPEGEFIKELHRVIEDQNFHINKSKTRLQKDGYRKEVTGLLVNEKANVQKRYVKQLRMWLYYWERYGYGVASGFFLKQHIADKGHLLKGKPDMANVISGKLDYLKMVKGIENSTYLKLKNRFDLVLKKDEQKTVSTIELDQILNILVKEGLDKAMELFSKMA